MEIKHGETWDNYLSRLLEMVKSGNQQAIAAHVKEHPLYKESEAEFVKNSSFKQLIPYLLVWNLDDEGEQALRNRSDYSEIMKSLEKNQQSEK